MVTPTKVDEAHVHGGRLVKPGDTVSIVPITLSKREDEADDSAARRQFNFLQEWLGDGPFTILWIGLWPCGKRMLFLSGAKCSESGVYTHNVM